MSAAKVYAVPWFRESDYSRLRGLAVDWLPDTYAEWRAGAEQSIANGESRGILCERVLVDVEAMHAWCIETNQLLNLGARHHFAQLTLAMRDAKAGHC